jgi:hypothetical protein
MGFFGAYQPLGEGQVTVMLIGPQPCQFCEVERAEGQNTNVSSTRAVPLQLSSTTGERTIWQGRQYSTVSGRS